VGHNCTVNRTTVTDPTIRQPGFNVTHLTRIVSGKSLSEWKVKVHVLQTCTDAEIQTTADRSRCVCPLTKFEGDCKLQPLHDTDALSWRENTVTTTPVKWSKISIFSLWHVSRFKPYLITAAGATQTAAVVFPLFCKLQQSPDHINPWSATESAAVLIQCWSAAENSRLSPINTGAPLTWCPRRLQAPTISVWNRTPTTTTTTTTMNVKWFTVFYVVHSTHRCVSHQHALSC